MRIVLTGGCTGGHIYPAIAIGDRFRSADADNSIIYIASGEPLERTIIPSAGYKLYEVPSEPLDRSHPVRFAKTSAKTLRGAAEASRIMRRFRPDAVISTGSYVSVPVVLAAAAMRIPVFMHEQNGYPGISNRMFAGAAKCVFLGFAGAEEYFGRKTRTIYSGNPVRSDFCGRDRKEDRRKLGIPENDLAIMVFGGSLGSETTNEIGEAVAREYAGREGYTVIWGTGRNYFDRIDSGLRAEDFRPSNVRVIPYIKNMPETLSAVDIVISRSGALTVAETTMAGRAAVFIPSPNVTADHQYYNARAVADKGGAFIVRENENTVRDVMRILRSLDADRTQIDIMSEAALGAAPVDATDIIYNKVMETLKS